MAYVWKKGSETARDSWALFAAVTIQVLVSLSFWFAPMILGALAGQLQFSPEQLGLVASADLVGMLLGALFALYWIYRVNWRLLLVVLLPLLALINLACAHSETVETLLLLRFSAGLVVGSVMSVTSTVIGAGRSPERHFALFVGVQGSVAAVGLLALPALIAAIGVSGPYYLLAVLAGLGCLFLTRLPASGVAPRPQIPRNAVPEHGRGLSLGLVVLVLPGLLFHVGVAASWTFIERLGVAAGLQDQAIATALSASMVASILGSVFAIALGVRWGRLLPLSLAMVIQVVALYLLMFHLTTLLLFQIAVMGLAFCFNFVIGYQLGLAISMDESGRVPIAYLIMLKIGMALGPWLSVQFMSSADLRPVLYVSALFYAGSYLYCLVLMRVQSLRQTRFSWARNQRWAG